MTKIIDSCVFIAYFRINENDHNQAKKIIETSKEILVNDYILSEIYTVLLLRESQEKARKALAWITSNSQITVKRLNNYEIKAVINFIDKNNTRLSFVDISLLIMSQVNGDEIVSFDKELLKLKILYET